MKLFIFKLVLYWKVFTGHRYVVNMGSKEIHDLHNLKYQCSIEAIKQRKWITEKQLPLYLSVGLNGCRWCMPKFDTDMKK